MSHRKMTLAETGPGMVRQSIRRAILPLAVILLTQAVSAQSVGIAEVSGTIVTPIGVTATSDLTFGNVLQGIPKAVARTAVGADTSAAVFMITGHGGAGITIDFLLPEYLSNGSGDRLPVSFSATDCTVDSLAGTPDSPGAGAWTGVNPFNLPAANIGATNNSTSVYLGGKVTPAGQQAPGAYTGDIIITVTYDGT